MVKIQNSDAIKEIRDAARLSISEGFPQDLAKSIVPVMEMNPNLLRKTTVVFEGSTTATGALTLGTSSSTKDTYVTGFTFNYIKDATCDTASGNLRLLLTRNGQILQVARMAVLTLTAQSGQMAHQFANPIKIDRGTAVQIGSNTFTAGAMVRAANVYGYEVEP